MHPVAATPKKTLTHLAYIDALRGIAFLGVLMIHSGLQCPRFHFFDVAMAGALGVQLFFLLSAITLFRSLNVRGTKEDHPIRNFYIRRFFRIAPLFWVAILFSYFLNGTGPTEWAPTGLHPWQFVTTTFFLHGWTPSSINSVVPGGWSMAVEMTFYAVLPWIFHHVTDFWAALRAGFIALGLGAFVGKVVAHFLLRGSTPVGEVLVENFLRFWFPAQFCVFLFGAALFYVLQNEGVMSSIAGNRTRAGTSCSSAVASAGGYRFVSTQPATRRPPA